MTGYSASKAAAHSLTGARGARHHRPWRVSGGHRHRDAQGDRPAEASPTEVATGVLDGLEEDREDIFPDPDSQALAAIWWNDPKDVERAFSGATA